MTRPSTLVLITVLCVICWATMGYASIFASIPVDFNGSEVHFTLELDCGGDLCLPETVYEIKAPKIDCAQKLTADLVWLTGDTNTVIRQRLVSPFDFTVPSPFTNNQYANQRVKAYFRIIKDFACDEHQIQTAAIGDATFVINDSTRLPAKQQVATPPFGNVSQKFSEPLEKAVMKIYPKTTDAKDVAKSQKIEFELTSFAIPDFNFIETVEIIPTGHWQLSPIAPTQLKCIFFFEDDNKDYVYALWAKTTTGGNYNSYQIQVADHHIPNIASSIILTCTTDQTTPFFTPDLSLASNGLVIRYASGILDPTFEVQSFVSKPLTTLGKTTPQLQPVDMTTQVGPWNKEQYPYFTNGQTFHPIISRYYQDSTFVESAPVYNSYYQFEYPVVGAGNDLSVVDREGNIMWPCLMHEKYRWKVSTQEFGLVTDPTKPPTVDDMKKQIKMASFSVSCLAGTKGKVQTAVVYVGNFTLSDVKVLNYLTDTSLPQYPLLTFDLVSQDEVDFKKFNSCDANSYHIQIFFQITSSTVPSTSSRNRGTFTLENRYDYAAGTWETAGGFFTDSAMFSLTTVAQTAAKQRYIYSTANNPSFQVSYDFASNRRYQLKTLGFVVPQGNGDGQPEGRHDQAFEIAVAHPGWFFTTDPSASNTNHLVELTCSISPPIDDIKTVLVVVESHHLIIEGYPLSKVNGQSAFVEIKCDQKNQALYLKGATANLPTDINFFIQQESVVTAPVKWSFTPHSESSGHLFRNVVIAIVIIVLIGVLVYFGIKFYKKQQVKKDENRLQLEATDFTLPVADSGGYDNLQN